MIKGIKLKNGIVPMEEQFGKELDRLLKNTAFWNYSSAYMIPN